MSLTRKPPSFVIAMSEDVITSAERLSYSFHVNENINDLRIRKFTDFKTERHRCYPLGSSNTPESSYVFLGHANQSSFGNLSAKEFVTAFKKSLTGDISKIDDIYLVGCEMGLPNAKGRVLAQEIADEFAKQGFSSTLRIHSITPPENAATSDKAAMYVEVINRESKADELLVREGKKESPRGKFNAFIFNDAKEAKRYADLIEFEENRYLTVAEMQEKQELRNRAYTFLSEASAVTELNKEYNIYIGNEVPKSRNARINEEIVHEKEFAQKRLDAIQILRQQIRHLREKKKDSDKATRLEALTNLLEKTYSVNCRNHTTVWMDFIKQYKNEFKSLGVEKGTTYKLLDNLSKGHINEAKKIIADQSKSKNELKEEKKKTKKQNQNKEKAKDKSKNAESKPINAESPSPSSSASTSASNSPRREDRFAGPHSSDDEDKPFIVQKPKETPIAAALAKVGLAPNGKDPRIENAKIYLKSLHNTYTKELEDNAFLQFFRNLLGTKSHKLRAVDKLLAVANTRGVTFENLQTEVDKILGTDTKEAFYRSDDQNADINPDKVLRSALHKRTKDILVAIRNDDAAKLQALANAVKPETTLKK